MLSWFRHDGVMSNHHEARDRWRRIIREQQASGLSAAAFCRRAGVSPWSFYSWRRRLRDEDTFTELTIAPTRGEADPDTVEPGEASRSKRDHVAASETNASPGEIEWRLPGGWSVMVRPEFDRPTLSALLTVLESHPHSHAHPNTRITQGVSS